MRDTTEGLIGTLYSMRSVGLGGHTACQFIVNTGQATASDVLALMERIQQVIKGTYDVGLVPEVLVVGER